MSSQLPKPLEELKASYGPLIEECVEAAIEESRQVQQRLSKHAAEEAVRESFWSKSPILVMLTIATTISVVLYFNREIKEQARVKQLTVADDQIYTNLHKNPVSTRGLMAAEAIFDFVLKIKAKPFEEPLDPEEIEALIAELSKDLKRTDEDDVLAEKFKVFTAIPGGTLVVGKN